MSYRSQIFCYVTAGALLLHGNSLAGPSQWFFSSLEYLHKMVAGRLAQTVPYSLSNKSEVPQVEILVDVQHIMRSSMHDRERSLLQAATSGDYQTVKGIITSYSMGHPILARAIEYAAQQNHAATVNCLLRARGHNLDQVALVSAAQAGHASLIDILLEQGTDLNGDIGKYALLEAIEKEHTIVIDCLLRAGADVRLRDDATQYTPLLVAARSNNPKLIDTLISLGACIEDEDCSGDSALLVAARSGAQEALKRLHDRGAKIDAKNFENHTALSLAARHGHIDLVATLLGMGLKHYDEALIETFDGGHTNVARLLIQAGATVESNTQTNNPLLLQLLPHVWPSMIRLFLCSGAHPNHIIHGDRPLIRMLNYVGHTWQIKLAKKTSKGLYAWLAQLRKSVDMMLSESDTYSELLHESAKQCIKNARSMTINDQQQKQLHATAQCQKTIKWLLSLLFAKTLYEFSSRGAHPLSDQKWQQIYRDLKNIQPLARDRVMARQLQTELKRIQPLFRERVVARQNEINAFLLKYDVSQVVAVLIKQLDGGPVQPVTSV